MPNRCAESVSPPHTLNLFNSGWLNSLSTYAALIANITALMKILLPLKSIVRAGSVTGIFQGVQHTGW